MLSSHKHYYAPTWENPQGGDYAKKARRRRTPTIQATASFWGKWGCVRETRARVSARAAHMGASSCWGYTRHQSHRPCLGGNRWLGHGQEREHGNVPPMQKRFTEIETSKIKYKAKSQSTDTQIQLPPSDTKQMR